MDDKIKHSLLEKLAMNIVYQLDDDSGLSVDWRQANNDKRVNFVLSILKQARLEALREVKKTIFKQSAEIGACNYYNQTSKDSFDIAFAMIDEQIDNLITQPEND